MTYKLQQKRHFMPLHGYLLCSQSSAFMKERLSILRNAGYMSEKFIFTPRDFTGLENIP